MALTLKGFSKFSKAQLAEKAWSQQKQLEYANLLLAKGLKGEAALALENYIDTSKGDKKELAKVCYRLGNIYMDLYEYEKALTSFYKAEMLDKKADFKDEMNGKIVEALEKLGMSSQAQYELEARTAIGGTPKREGKVVARIGKEEITDTQINEALDRLPEWSRKEFQTEEARQDFIKEYVATEVLYRKAKRLGLDKTPQTRKEIEALKKQLVVGQLVQKQISDKLRITPEELKLYYKANKDKYVEETKTKNGKKVKRQKKFPEVKVQVEYDYKLEKQKELTSALLKKALEEQEVEIFYEPSKKKKQKSKK